MRKDTDRRPAGVYRIIGGEHQRADGREFFLGDEVYMDSEEASSTSFDGRIEWIGTGEPGYLKRAGENGGDLHELAAADLKPEPESEEDQDEPEEDFKSQFDWPTTLAESKWNDAVELIRVMTDPREVLAAREAEAAGHKRVRVLKAADEKLKEMGE